MFFFFVVTGAFVASFYLFCVFCFTCLLAGRRLVLFLFVVVSFVLWFS